MLNLISLRLDGELSSGQEQELAEHLAACPECKALADDLAGIHSVMPGMNVEPPDFLMERVMERIKAETPVPIPFPVRKEHSRHLKTWGSTAAALVLVAAGAFALWGGPDGGTGAPVTLDAGTPSASHTPEIYKAVPETRPSATAVVPESQAPMAIQEPLATPASEPVPEDPGKQAESHTPSSPTVENGTKMEAPANGAAPRNGIINIEQSPQPSATPTPTPVQEDKRAPAAFVATTGVLPLTPAEAAKKLYEEKFTQTYTDAAFVESEDFIGYVILNMAIRYEGQTEDGLAYEFAQVYSEGETETVAARYLVSLDGSEIQTLDSEPAE